MRRELLIYLSLFAILLMIPTVVRDGYTIGILITCLVWGTMASVWNFTMGYAGIFTFGQFGFFVLGAYTSGMLSKFIGLTPWLTIVAGGLVACLAGVLLGLPCLRLKGSYIALITWGFHLVMGPLIKVAGPLGTGGSTGLMSIPKLEILGVAYSRTNLIPWYYTALGFSFLILTAIYRTIFSTVGLGFVGLRDSEDFARGLGLNEYKNKLMIFGFSAFLTGIIGAFYAHYAGIISPRLLGLDIFLLVMLMLIIGGIGKFPGAFIGAFIIMFLNEILRPLGGYRFLIFGAIVIIAIKLMPEGLLGRLERLKRKSSGKSIINVKSND